MAALSLIALLTIVSQCVVQFLIADQKHDSRIINIAGRQRMLSQKITKTSLYVVNSSKSEAANTYKQQLLEALELWQRSHTGLQNGDMELGLPGDNSKEITALFEKIDPNYEAIVAASNVILSDGNDLEVMQRALSIIAENEAVFLMGMDAIVFRYDREAKGKVEFVRWLAIVLMVVTLLALLLEARLIFAPAARRIRQQMKNLIAREQDLKRLFDVSPIALMMVDTGNMHIMGANKAAVELTGFSLTELQQKVVTDLLSGASEELQKFTDGLHGNETLSEFELSLQDVQGNSIQIQVSSRMVQYGDQKVYVLGFSNISELKNTQSNLEYHANYDKLTDLPNRWMLRSQLKLELKKADRAHQKVGVLLLDLDNFKDVNDSLGHDVGDLLLKKAAQRLSSCARESDIVARLGGDEFVIVLGSLSETESVERVTSSILKRIAEPFNLFGDEAQISTSIGVTIYPDDAVEIEDLFKNADQAMYAAKKAGRNRRNYFKQSMQDAAMEKMLLTNQIRTGIDKDQFVFYYQPIVELATGVVRKAEALIRWELPGRGLVPPSDFIPVVEGTNYINEIGNLSFEKAARQVAKWRQEYDPDFQVSINISAAQFRQQNNFFESWQALLNRLRLSGRGITLEITEGLLLDASENVKKMLRAFNEVGIEVAIDDFGTGYSSLSYIQKFDIDYIKIDRSFMINIAPGSNDMVLCEAIVSMAHKLNLKVIAEGVETEEQCSLLKEMGCDFAQGYLFSKPVPAEQFTALLIEQST